MKYPRRNIRRLALTAPEFPSRYEVIQAWKEGGHYIEGSDYSDGPGRRFGRAYALILLEPFSSSREADGWIREYENKLENKMLEYTRALNSVYEEDDDGSRLIAGFDYLDNPDLPEGGLWLVVEVSALDI